MEEELNDMALENDLVKIEKALNAARQTAAKYTSGAIESQLKSGGDPVTAADVELNAVLRDILVEDDDGWLSEETVDDMTRLNKKRIWIVDPIDGTREFIEGIPEWCISIGLAENGKVIAAGICNPASDELFLGSYQTGVTLNGKPVAVTERSILDGAIVSASRSEVKRGQWDAFADAEFEVIPTGSVAYKLACVSAGLVDATFTLVPKNEWDIAAGVLLVQAAGGQVVEISGEPLIFNKPRTLIKGLVASNEELCFELCQMLKVPV